MMAEVARNELPLVTHVVGARPNIMKLGPLWHELAKSGQVRQRIVHTGQHWDGPLSGELFEDFRLPPPDVNFGVGSLEPVRQFSAVIDRLADELTAHRPALTVTYGDVRSTPAAAICSHHMGVKTAHYEGGLRSFTRIWSEEFHRISADAYSEIVFTTEPHATENCVRERGSSEGVHEVGDLMCDAARMLTDGDEGSVADKKGLGSRYAVFTTHHTNNVDTSDALADTLGVLELLAERMPVVFPVHPRTLKNLAAFGLKGRLEGMRGVVQTPAMRYAEFIRLVKGSTVVAADSGSLCAECVYFGRPMLYLHPVNERELAVESGLVVTCARDLEKIARELDNVASATRVTLKPWQFDGRTSERIAGHVIALVNYEANR